MKLGKDDMVVLQGTPGQLMLQGTKATWEAAATNATNVTNQVASTHVQSPAFINFEINEQSR